MAKKKTVSGGYEQSFDDLDQLGGQDRAPRLPLVTGNINADEVERNRLLNLPVKP
jgi:hypothetical protein